MRYNFRSQRSAFPLMKPAAAAPRRGGRRAAIVLSLLASHGAVFGLGYSWHGLWGDYVAAPTHLQPAGGASAVGGGALSAFLAPPARDAGAEGAAAAAAAAAAADKTARAAAAGAAANAVRAASAAAAVVSASAGVAAGAAAGGVSVASAAALALSPAPAPVAAATPAPGLKPGEPGRVVELGTGGTDAWLDVAKPLIVNNTVIYTWTNFHMRDFLLNFLLHMKLVSTHLHAMRRNLQAHGGISGRMSRSAPPRERLSPKPCCAERCGRGAPTLRLAFDAQHGITSFLVGAMDPELHKYLLEARAPACATVACACTVKARR
jgi:hypothetical protein